MGYIGERSAVNEGRSVFGGLDQIGIDGVLQQHGDGSAYAQVPHSQWPVIPGVAQEYVVYASAQVIQVLCETEYGHYLGGRGNVEARLVGLSVHSRPEAGHYLPEGTVIDIQDPAPEYLLHPEAFLPVLVNVVVQEGGNHIVGGSDCVEVSSKMQVYPVHREHLGISATGRSALHAETGSQRGFPEGQDRFVTATGHSQGQPHRNGGLAYSRLGGSDGSHEYELAFLPVLPCLQAVGDLGYVASVSFYLFPVYAKPGSYLFYGLERRFPCDFDIRFHRGSK